MEQMNIPGEMRVDIDLTGNERPRTIRTLLPLVYKDDDSFCCLLGPDPGNGVFARGETPEEALKNWDQALRTRIIDPGENDEVAQYAIDSLSVHKKDVW